MKSYLDVYLSTEGADLGTVIQSLKNMGLNPMAGPHDFLLEWATEEEFLKKMKDVHIALKGTGATYHVETVTSERGGRVKPWPPFSIGNPKE